MKKRLILFFMIVLVVVSSTKVSASQPIHASSKAYWIYVDWYQHKTKISFHGRKMTINGKMSISKGNSWKTKKTKKKLSLAKKCVFYEVDDYRNYMTFAEAKKEIKNSSTIPCIGIKVKNGKVYAITFSA